MVKIGSGTKHQPPFQEPLEIVKLFAFLVVEIRNDVGMGFDNHSGPQMCPRTFDLTIDHGCAPSRARASAPPEDRQAHGNGSDVEAPRLVAVTTLSVIVPLAPNPYSHVASGVVRIRSGLPGSKLKSHS